MTQRPLDFSPQTLPERLRKAGGIYQWLRGLLEEAAATIEHLEMERESRRTDLTTVRELIAGPKEKP